MANQINSKTKPAYRLHQMRLLTRQAMMPLDDMKAFHDKDAKPLSDDQKERLSELEYISSNTLVTVFAGVQSIGAMLAEMASLDGDVSGDSVGREESSLTIERQRDIGWLIEGLGHMTQELCDSRRDIDEIEEQQIRIGARPVPAWR